VSKTFRNVALGLLIIITALVVLIDPKNLLLYKWPNAPLNAQGQNIAQELGYPANTKLLVVNSDDTAAHATFSEGVFAVMQAGLVKSTSVIVHNHNDDELIRVAKIARQHPEYGIGIHLMLTNEYQQGYSWTPVLPQTVVPTLYNKHGLAWEKISDVEQYADPEQVLLEIEAQIQKAQALGITLSHIDSHMGTLLRDSRYPGASKDALRMAALAMARKYSLPIPMNAFDEAAKSSLAYMDANRMIRPDTFFGFYELSELNSHLSYQGSAFNRWITALTVKMVFGFDLPYQNHSTVSDDVKVRMAINKAAIASLVSPGLNHFYMHAAVAVSASGLKIPNGKNHAEGADKIVRLGDAVVWSSEEMRVFLRTENIQLINYTQLQKIQSARAQANRMVVVR
jgi:predicted glycoside hydrolase/deacetylase ChbG (UPF0249 family)